jgi:hypothetical protein
MNRLGRKSKMVSFRVYPDEYAKLCEACETRGVESVSELARVALQTLIGFGATQSAKHQLLSLEDRIRMLTAELKRLRQRLDRIAPDPE